MTQRLPHSAALLWTRTVAATLMAGFVLLGCGPALAPDVVATFSGGVITTDQVAVLLQALPEGERFVANETGTRDLLKGLIERAAMPEILKSAARPDREHSEDELEARWALIAAREATTLRQLTADHPPSAEAIALQAAQLENKSPEERWNYRHLYFRTDRAETSRQRQAIRQHAESIRQRAVAGEDFTELVIEHSESADAAEGGLVQNQRPSLLDPIPRAALATLSEGDVSQVIESRTGLHVLAMERRLQPPGSPIEPEALAQRRAAQLVVNEARQELLSDLRTRLQIQTDTFPWTVGAEHLSEAEFAWLQTRQPIASEDLVDRLLLAQESELTTEHEEQLRAQVRSQREGQDLAKALAQIRAEVLSTVSQSQLRPIYDAQPSAFSSQQTAHVDLIFVPQGPDAFATQQRLEQLVTELRGGTSFAKAARSLSTGPGTQADGDLGELPPREWARLGPQIYKAINAMQAGAISEPIFCTGRVFSTDPALLRGGFAVVRVRKKTAAQPRTFEEALDDVRSAWAARNAAALEEATQSKVLDQAAFRIVRLPEPEELLSAAQ